METEPSSPKPKQGVRTYFTKKEWGLLWKTILGTLGVSAITAGPFIGWVLKAKEEQIATLRESNTQLVKHSATNIDLTLEAVQLELAKFRMAFPMSTFDGTVALGNSSKSTVITGLLLEAQNFLNSKKYDAAEQRLMAADRLWPGFPGANFFRFKILEAKGDGYQKEAEAMAERVIATMTDATDYLQPLYRFVVDQKLARGEKAAAEQLFLKAIQKFPSETNIVPEFVRLFGYTPAQSPK